MKCGRERRSDGFDNTRLRPCDHGMSGGVDSVELVGWRKVGTAEFGQCGRTLGLESWRDSLKRYMVWHAGQVYEVSGDEGSIDTQRCEEQANVALDHRMSEELMPHGSALSSREKAIGRFDGIEGYTKEVDEKKTELQTKVVEVYESSATEIKEEEQRIKHHKGHVVGIRDGGNNICFGKYMLQASEPAHITSRQIKAGRKALQLNVRRGGAKGGKVKTE
ncbi:ribosomal protein L16 [Tanacetum coccineum]